MYSDPFQKVAFVSSIFGFCGKSNSRNYQTECDRPSRTYLLDESALFHRNLSSTERNPAFSKSLTPRRTVLSDIFSSLAMVGMAGQHTPSRFALPRRYRYTAMARLGRSL